MTSREALIETVNKLFIYTDNRNWSGLISEVFHHEVHLDMSSLGTDPVDTTPQAICDQWEAGFKGIDSINHLAGNYLVTFKEDDQANVFAYATATHYKKEATQGHTREFVGTYDLDLTQTEGGWRIHKFAYHLKYMNGNLELT